MYFDFDDARPETPTITGPLTLREGVLVSIIVHFGLVILILIAPDLPWVKAWEDARQQALLEQRQQELERLRERQSARFVFVEPRIDTPAARPPERADLSDMDRRARTVERPPVPRNPLPFSRGNSPELVEGPPSVEAREPAAAAASEPSTDAHSQAQNGSPAEGYMLPPVDRTTPGAESRSQGAPQGVIADAIRNLQRYTQRGGHANLEGGSGEFGPAIQFDTKGVEFGPWIRRFVAQIRRNWFIPYAAMSMRGHVVVTFYVHKDGRITELSVLKPASVDAFTHSAYNALAASNPTHPLPPEYPDDRAFFTVTFYFNETPDSR